MVKSKTARPHKDEIIIPQSHDVLFKLFMQNRDIAKEFVELHAPKEIIAICDLTTLQIEPNSFVEEDLKQRYCDMLYSVNTTQGLGYLYCLVEMQSTPDKQIAFRMMRYSFMAIENHLKQNKKSKIPLVVPLLFYCGKRPHPNSISLNWLDLFTLPNLAKQLYTEPFKLIDVTQLEDSEIKSHKKIGMLEYIFKHIQTRDLLNMVDDITHFLLLNAIPKSLQKSVLIYTLNRGKINQPQAFIDALNNQSEQSSGDNDMVSMAQYLEERGIEKGLQLGEKRGIFQGRKEGINLGSKNATISIAKNLLQNGVSIELIQKSTGLSEEEIKKLKS